MRIIHDEWVNDLGINSESFEIKYNISYTIGLVTIKNKYNKLIIFRYYDSSGEKVRLECAWGNKSYYL